MRKRSRPDRRPPRGEPSGPALAPAPPAFPPTAFVRAYEAQLREPASGPGLLSWAGDEDVLADRHNIIHLLTDLPSPRPASVCSLSSSWSVASDADEAFDLSGDEEVAAHARAQRQKWVDGLRAARLAEREREDDEEAARAVAEQERKRDETPPPDIAQLMTHTARSLAASPNPAMLISRIMTRHAADARFAFLRKGDASRWSSAWERAKLDAGLTSSASTSTSRPGVAKPSAKGSAQAQGSGALGLGLGGYGSDDESGSSGRHASSSPPPPPPDGLTPPPPPPGPPPPSPPPPPPPL